MLELVVAFVVGERGFSILNGSYKENKLNSK
jgi:hypothetical protein